MLTFYVFVQDINQIHEMFPTTDKSVIKTVLTAKNGNTVRFKTYKF